MGIFPSAQGYRVKNLEVVNKSLQLGLSPILMSTTRKSSGVFHLGGETWMNKNAFLTMDSCLVSMRVDLGWEQSSKTIPPWAGLEEALNLIIWG